MHRILRPDGTMRQSSFLRWVSTFAYVSFTAGAVLFLLSPELQNVYRRSGETMAVFICAGGLFSALGAATRRWIGEFIGLPLLAVGIAVLGCETWLLSHAKFPLLAAGNLAFLLGLSFLMLVRWRMVVAVFRFVQGIANAEKRHREEQAGERKP